MEDEDDGWRYVIASKNRHIKGDITTWGKYSNSKNFDKNNFITSKPGNVDISKVIENINSIMSTIKTSGFYRFLIEKVRKIASDGLKLIVLGCASPTCGPFITNCKYQWALAKLLTLDDLLKISSVEIYDPIMSDADYQIWKGLVEIPKTSTKNDWTFLIMPHCEVDLYRTVIESLSHNLDIVKSAKELASGEYNSRNILKLGNVMLLSNTLINCEGLDAMDDIVEVKLPKFDHYPSAFNDLYIITIGAGIS